MKYICILISIILLCSCSKEKLQDSSVVYANYSAENITDLDNFILNEFTKPYNIAVHYRWNKNTAPKGEYLYPPKPEKVQEVLKALQYLWLETYTLPSLGGKDFFKGKNPINIYMYGGKNIDFNGVELINNSNATEAEMHIYNVNNFNAKDYADVFILMRSVHNQFSKQLLELYPYNRDKFIAISQHKYLYNTKDLISRFSVDERVIRSLHSCQPTNIDEYMYVIDKDDDYINLKKGFFSTGKYINATKIEKKWCNIVRDEQLATEGVYANSEGFFSVHSMLSPEDEFADIISCTLTHTKAEKKKKKKKKKK